LLKSALSRIRSVERGAADAKQKLCNGMACHLSDAPYSGIASLMALL
jgi:hypothetical protein